MGSVWPVVPIGARAAYRRGAGGALVALGEGRAYAGLNKLRAGVTAYGRAGRTDNVTLALMRGVAGDTFTRGLQVAYAGQLMYDGQDWGSVRQRDEALSPYLRPAVDETATAWLERNGLPPVDIPDVDEWVRSNSVAGLAGADAAFAWREELWGWATAEWLRACAESAAVVEPPRSMRGLLDGMLQEREDELVFAQRSERLVEADRRVKERAGARAL